LFGPLYICLGYDEGNLPIGEDAGLGLMNSLVAVGLLLLAFVSFLGSLPVWVLGILVGILVTLFSRPPNSVVTSLAATPLLPMFIGVTGEGMLYDELICTNHYAIGVAGSTVIDALTHHHQLGEHIKTNYSVIPPKFVFNIKDSPTSAAYDSAVQHNNPGIAGWKFALYKQQLAMSSGYVGSAGTLHAQSLGYDTKESIQMPVAGTLNYFKGSAGVQHPQAAACDVKGFTQMPAAGTSGYSMKPVPALSKSAIMNQFVYTNFMREFAEMDSYHRRALHCLENLMRDEYGSVDDAFRFALRDYAQAIKSFQAICTPERITTDTLPAYESLREQISIDNFHTIWNRKCLELNRD